MSMGRSIFCSPLVSKSPGICSMHWDKRRIYGENKNMKKSSVIGFGVLMLIAMPVLVSVPGHAVSNADILEKSVYSATTSAIPQSMFNEAQAIFLIIMVFTAINVYFSIRAWPSWKHTDDDILRAKAFLSKDFLYRNFVLVFITSASFVIHTVLGFIETFEYPGAWMQFTQQIRILSLLTLTASMLLLVLLEYYWCKLLIRKTLKK